METMGNSPERSKTIHLQTQIPTLPMEIIISEILSRLPVKPLLRFRCVSKQWCSLISSSKFVKLHLKVSVSRKDYALHQILSTVIPTLTQFSLTQCSLQSLISEPMTKAVEVDNPMHNSPQDVVRIVGSCHGLICITIGLKDMFIWNPSIGKFKKVPNLSVNLEFGSYFIYGFGYDEFNDDYKVVSIVCGLKESNVVMMYSLSSDSWKRIGDLKGKVLSNDDGKYVKGKIHCAVSPSFNGWEIVSLDLAKEVYGKVEQPNYGGIYSNLTLGVVCDNLCVLSLNGWGRLIDFWVMKEYGVNESWTKIVIHPPELFSSPFCITENGEVVLVVGSAFAFYDPKNKELRYPVITNFRGAVLVVSMYVESLVSPVVNSEAGREKQMEKAMD